MNRPLIFAAAIVIILDRISKMLVQALMEPGQSIPLIRDILHLSYVMNTGIAFGLFQDANIFWTIMTVIIIGVIIWKFPSFENKLHYPLALIIGAGIGNLADRIAYGSVIDFIDLRVWPVFNIADAAVCVCIAWILVLEFRPAQKTVKPAR